MTGTEGDSGVDDVVTILGMRAIVSADFQLDIPRLDIPKGACVCLVGHNGAGKTCLLESIVGLRESSASVFQVIGRAPADFNAHPMLRRAFGVQLQRCGYTNEVRVKQIVALHRAVYPQVDATVAASLGIDELLPKLYGNLSRGQKQRVDVYVALAHRPEVAILDEPTTGLDGHYAAACTRLITERSGQTVIMSTNTEPELETAELIVWLSRGRVIRTGSAGEILQSATGRYRAEIGFSNADLAGRCAVLMGQETSLTRMTRPDSLSLVLLSNDPIEPILRPFLGEAKSYAFGPSGYRDFLAVAAQEVTA